MWRPDPNADWYAYCDTYGNADPNCNTDGNTDGNTFLRLGRRNIVAFSPP